MILNNAEKRTIRSLFEEKVQFSIPSYQRAYSWEVDGSVRKHVRQFLLDLEEQHPDKDYYLGHFLFEEDQGSPNTLFVIDGQQRLTTVVIFFSCLIRELKGRSTTDEAAGLIMELNPQRLDETYLRRDGKRRFKTVKSDAVFFDERILDRTSLKSGDTRSRKRIADADMFFTQEFKETDTATLLRWARLVEGAVITTFQVRDKVQATQIFSFQNDRGKALTELEKLKAVLVYQVYLNSAENEEIEAIEHVEECFAEIYAKTEEINLLNEDQVLNHHCTAYLKRWDKALENVKHEIKEIKDRAGKVKWVKKFSSELRDSFVHVKALENLLGHHVCIADPIILDGPNSWPILIKLYKFFGEGLLSPKFSKCLRTMELALFKLHFLHRGCVNDLPAYAKTFNGEALGSIAELEEKLEQASKISFRGGQNCDQALRDALTGHNQYHNPFGYLLWKYENSLRAHGDHQLMPSNFLNFHAPRTHQQSIDHIAPQEPVNVYPEEFRSDCLNDLGNLVYMTRSMNSSKRNTPPLDMGDAFWDSTCASHREIKATIVTSGKWGKDEIVARKQKIVNFALARWDAANPDVTITN